jgi:uncharacterized protein with PIN domain
MANVVEKCPRCEYTCEFKHMHDTAHGIPETHMSGSERFECTQCGHMIFLHSDGASKFNFILDGRNPDARGA